ncbi:filamentous hemagglutinin N-terminal domain-containing protein [Aliarcobacter lanthieri]|uniref:two-partner secretion domain-containing protein n=1 Tax=Aliarcobacter lanthieri TaxID=1355374 RepID=UPI003AAAC1E7
MKKYIKNIISVNITISLFLQQTLLASGLAVDTNAPKQNQATIEKARNNVPIVNIVKPNEKGLSHNKFNDYNVNKEGLILNNSNKREVNTQLSGYIYGNENLKNSNTAKTILNEVTSKNQTHLKGFTEVAGDRANVVVANPNGIYINGAGFINTQKATITTGNPNIINGQISGYEIRQGYINIDGEGLNTSNINKAELYANALKINAKIHASDLDIVTGKNSISENGDIKKLSEKDNENNILSLDSSVLGGIYANKINLVGTSKGVGVNLPIEIIAQDDFKLTTDGKIVLDKVISEKDIKIKSNSSDVNSNIVYGNNVNIEAKESITNKDILASKTNIDLKAKNIINENLIASGVNEDLKDTQNGSLNIKSENLDNKNRIYAKDNIDINSKNIKGLENSSLVAKKDITIKAEDIKNDENTTIQSNNNLSLTTSNFKGNGSKIQASNIDIKSDNIESNNSKITSTNGNITIQSSILDLDNAEQIASTKDINIISNEAKINNSKIFSQNGNILLNSEDLSLNNSNITAFDKIDIKSDILKTKNGNIQALKDINITSKNIDNENGLIATNENINISSQKDGLFNNVKGILQSGKNLSLNIFDFKSDNSNIQASNIDIKANSIESNNSNILSVNSDLVLNANSIIIEDSYIQAKNTLNFNSKNNIELKDNTIISNNLYLSADEINLNGSSQTKNILLSKNDILINTKKLIANYLFTQSNNDININSSNIDLKNSKLQNVAFIGSDYTNGYKQGNINLVTTNLNLYNTNLASNNINIINQANKELTSFVVENSSLDVNNNINIATSNLSSRNSKYLASNNLDLNTNKSIVFLNNHISGNSVNLTVNENLTLDKSNSLEAQNNLNLTTKSLINNAQFISNGSLTINTSDFIVNNSLINAKNILSLNATNYILNNDSNEEISGIRGAFTNLNTKLLTNYGFISSLYDMNIKVDDLINYGGIASANGEKYSSNMFIETTNFTNYNTIYSNDNINLYVKNSLKNITDKTKVDLGNEKATIFATNNITMQGDKNRTLRTDEIVNDKAIIQTKNADINIFAKKLENLNDKAIMTIKDNGSNKYSLNVSRNKLYTTSEYIHSDENSRRYYSIGEKIIIEQLKQEDIDNGIYYNIKNIGSSCGSTKFKNVNITNNCYDKSNNSVIINDIKYNSNEYHKEEKTIYDEYNSYTTWEIKYKDKSSQAEELEKFAYEIEVSRVLEELDKIYSPLSSIIKPKYQKPTNIWLGRSNGSYSLEIINNSYYKSNAVNYEFNYKSQIDYFLARPELNKGGEILSGKNINFDISNVNNYLSKISAKNNITFNNTILNNQSETLYQYDSLTGAYKYCYKECNSSWHNPDFTWASFTPSSSQTKIDSLDSIILAGNNISGTLTELNNENKARVSSTEFITYNPTINTKLTTANIQTTKKITDNKSLDEKEQTKNIYLKDKIVINPIDSNYVLPTNKYSMFTTVNPNKNLDYLVESNPLYTNYNNFVGSSYFLEKLDYRGDRVIKRLGDAAYETKLVGDAIFAQIGQRTLNPDFQSENEQFVALMESAVNLSGILDLELGKPLNPYQIANLTEDIVWMEEQIVNGQIVLVPVVYLANNYDKLNGATIQAKNIDLNIKDNLYNSGTIKTQEYLNLNANSITNNSGVLLSNGKATLISNDDFINKNGGLIKGSDIQIASLNGNVINETYFDTNTINQGVNNFTYTNLGKISSIEAINGNLVIQAKNDITNIGANLKAKDSVLLQTQSGDINLNAIKLENGHNIYFSGGFDKAKDVEYQTSNIQANNILMQSGNNINLEASKLNADNQINLNALNDVNILALNNEYYRDVQTTKKGTFSKKTQRDMVYKESVNSAELNANDIYMSSGNDINLEAVNIQAKNEKIAHAENTLNILAKTYKEGELHHTSKSSFGGLIKNEYKYEKDNLKIKSSQITADNMILDAKTINVEASKLKANSVEISTQILNMISSKESLYENEFSIKGGVITATIENKGKIEEVVIPSTIEVNDKLIFNKKDITDKLETDNLIKILSSQGNLTEEQINLVKEIANSKEWHDKTTTLSGVGALVITAVVTYFTAGAGTGLVAGMSNAAIQTATQAAIQSVVVQATTSLVSAAITGNKPKLDLDSLVTSAVTAGVLSYAKGLIDVAEYGKVAQTLTDTTIQSGVQSVVFKTDFKDTLVSNLAMAGTNLAFENIGNISMSQELGEQNGLFKDGALGKIVLHSLTGGVISAIQDKDILSGVLSAGFREALSPLTANSSNEAKLLTSQLTGILVGGLVGGEEGANNGYIVSTSGELYNRQLHQEEINWLKDDKNIEEFANSKNISLEEARKELTQTALSLIDNNWKKVLKESDSDAETYLLNNVASIKNTTDLERANSFQNETVAINNIDFYQKYVHSDIQKDIATALKDDINSKATEYKEVFEKIKEQGVEKTLNVAKDKLGNYYEENTYLEMLKDGGKVLQSIIEDSANSVVKLGYNLTTSPKNLAEIYNISVEEATAIQAVLVVAAANEFGINKTKAADNVLDLGVDKKGDSKANDGLVNDKDSAKNVVNYEKYKQESKSIEDFYSKIPSNSKNSVTKSFDSNGNIILEATSEGKVPGSKAVYKKTIGKDGKTVGYEKTTYDPKGNIVHIKDKFND